VNADGHNFVHKFHDLYIMTPCLMHVLPKPCPLKSVSSDVTPRSMSFQKHISSDLCPLTSYSDLCPPKYMFPQIRVWYNTQIKVICLKKYPHRSVSSTFCINRKMLRCGINIHETTVRKKKGKYKNIIYSEKVW
jgi:hypothetical protein